MSNKPSNENHHNPEATYQTGVPYDHPRRSSGLIAVLLVLTIFLGGLASALGIVNIRLLQELAEGKNSSLPMNVFHPSSTQASTGGLLPAGDDSLAPQLPADRKLNLALNMPPKRLQEPMDAAAVYETHRQSIVQVHSSSHHTTHSGVGVVIDSRGFILTNAHIVDAAKRIYVICQDGTQYRAALVGMDILTDLALIYIETQDLPAIELADSGIMTEGEAIISSFNSKARSACPLRDGFLNTPKWDQHIGSYQLELIETTVGYITGPVFNSYGQLVGINHGQAASLLNLALLSDTGYAVPSTQIKPVVEALCEYGFVPGRPTLGIHTEALSKFYQQHWNLPGGLWLTQVSDQAQNMGLQNGDILLALDGVRLMDNEDFHRILFTHDIGETMTAVIFRDEDIITTTVSIYETAA